MGGPCALSGRLWVVIWVICVRAFGDHWSPVGDAGGGLQRSNRISNSSASLSIHTRVRSRTLARYRTHSHTLAHSRSHSHAPAHSRTLARARARLHTHAYTRARAHALAHTRAHSHTLTHTRTHSQTLTCTRSHSHTLAHTRDDSMIRRIDGHNKVGEYPDWFCNFSNRRG